MIIIIIDTLKDALLFVLSVLYDDSVYLSLGILIAVAIKTYVDFDKLKHFFSRSSGVSIFSSVAFGAFTPFCACGTMAITLSMLASALPWGPIMAFLTSSALMCPSTFVLYSGVVGLGFAIAVTLLVLFVHEKKKEVGNRPKQLFHIALHSLRPQLLFFLGISFLFSLGNSSDAFLLLRAHNLGFSTTLVVLTYVLYN
ncbi:MAG: permease, partial [Deltaproteobacteria bacterium]|nr:permease [Deltaproteobacteria bacterium]